MSNIREIAKRAGVGIATVSRYLNSNGYVKQQTAEKIQKAIDELNYVPNKHAKALFSSKSGAIGLITPSILNPYFSHWISEIGKDLRSKGFALIIFNSDDDPVKEAEAIQILREYRVEGLIVGRPQLVEEYANIGIPVVAFENRFPMDDLQNVSTVIADNCTGGKLAFEHLWDSGCRNILQIMGPSVFRATELRSEGFLRAAAAKGAKIELFQFDSEFDPQVDIEERLSGIDFCKYDGVFVFNDIAAAKVLQYLGENRIRVPQEIRVIGFDDNFVDKMLSPRLTTIRQSVEEAARICLDTLLQRVTKKKLPRVDVVFDVELVVRES